MSNYDVPDDQWMLQQQLSFDPSLEQVIFLDLHGSVINSPGATFIRQVMRSHQSNLDERILEIRDAVENVFAGQKKSSAVVDQKLELKDRTYSSTALVSALYQTLFMRKADPEGLHSSVAMHNAGRWKSLPDFITSMLTCREFAVNHPAFFQKYVLDGYARFTNDVSQYGEVGQLLKHIVNRSSATRIVVDVGARGRARSNSYDLMRHFGWRGLLVEANPNLIDKISEEFHGLDFMLQNCAVSNHDGDGTFYLGVNNDVSSLSENAAKGWGPVAGQVAIKIQRLASILELNEIPQNFDVLSLDIEGEDIGVLNDLIKNSEFRPRWIIIEVRHNHDNSWDGVPVAEIVRDRYAVVDNTASNLLLALR